MDNVKERNGATIEGLTFYQNYPGLPGHVSVQYVQCLNMINLLSPERYLVFLT